MTDTLKVFGQSYPAAGVLTTLYTVPALTGSAVSSIVACNQGPGTGAIRIAVQPAGAAILPQHYQVYDLPLQPNETRAFVLGITLAATDVISVQSGNGAVSFSAYGVQVT